MKNELFFHLTNLHLTYFTQFKNPKRELCSNHNSQFTIEAGTHDKDFTTIMSNNFNELPLHIHQITESKKFMDTLRTYLLDKAKEKYFI